MTDDVIDARARFLQRFVDEPKIYRALARMPADQRPAMTRAAARLVGVSVRTIQRRILRYYEPDQEAGTLHDLRCPGPTSCTCRTVYLVVGE